MSDLILNSLRLEGDKDSLIKGLDSGIKGLIESSMILDDGAI